MSDLMKMVSLMIAIALLATGCKKDDNKQSVTACINVDTTVAEVGQQISFTSCSQPASTYLWDFGDGQTATTANTSHAYSALGDFTVKLTVTNNNVSNTQTVVMHITPSTASPQPPDIIGLFTYADMEGLFIGLKNVQYQNVPGIGLITVELGIALAAVTQAGMPGSNHYAAMSSVKCNTNPLSARPNNSYGYQPGTADVDGIDFSSGATWQAEGSFSPFNYTLNGFPQNPVITSNTDSIVRSNGYTFTAGSIASADSIIYMLVSGDKYVEKRVAGNVNAVTFSAAELSALPITDYALLEIIPFKIASSTGLIPSKKTYFINEVIVSDAVKIR